MSGLVEWCENNNRSNILKEWDCAKNAGVTPEHFAPFSNKKVWWRCANGHSFESSIYHRTSRGQGCPICSGKKILKGYNDLKTLNPLLAMDWDQVKNDPITPESISLNSHKKYWWKCHKCAFEWQASPNDRFRGKSCPVCAKELRKKTRANTLLKQRENNLLIQHKELMTEWDYKRNTVRPEEILIGSGIRVWWCCSTCGNKWEASVHNRVNGSGCPKCMKHMRTSFPEQAIFFYLRQHFSKVYNGYCEAFESKRELDVYIPEINTAIEYDGVAFHSGSKAVNEMLAKYNLCREKNIRLIRVSEFQNDHKCYDDCIVRRGHSDCDLGLAIKELLSLLGRNCDAVDIVEDRPQIMQQYIISLREKSIAYRCPEAAQKWDVDRNDGLRPDQVGAFSHRKYWWKCSFGHSYQATPVNEVLDTKTCPICTNHRVLTGYNDLAYKAPYLAEEWDDEANDPIKPTEVIYTTQKKYWWLCPLGHHYYTGVSSRYYNKTGCPYCSNSKVLAGFNDLATKFPSLAKEWNYRKNDAIKPDEYLPGSNTKVWWICSKGHEWQATIGSRSGNSKAGCPVCSGKKTIKGLNDLATVNPEIMDEWNYERNLDIDPSCISPGAHMQVWWKCRICGNEWKCLIVSRTHGRKSGCPKCGYKLRMQKTRGERIFREKKDLCALFPELVKEWDFEKNTENPNEISPGSNKKVWWRCNKGHSYQAWITDRTGRRKTGCPYCHGKRKLDVELQ